MKCNLKEKINNLIEKIKNNRKLQILLLVLVVCVILLVYIAYFINDTNEETITEESYSASTTEKYVASLESKLENVLSNIEGVGEVSVAITVSSGFVYEYAYEEKSKGSLSSTTNSSSLILVNNEPVIISKIYPVISGVLVVAEGSENIGVKLNILESVQTLLDVANEDITILSGDF